MAKKLINPAALYDGTPFGMSQATVETESGLVFISGQVDWNHQYTNYRTDRRRTTEKS
ncbi:MAG: RidA family protein, partial [Leptolyngbyaceae cyanobacterium SL_5_14]|nr:RidA family protein [Leptolyngbyaceae cyanobacterium SL_5_14]